MRPFEFIMLFFSFIYALALTHLLLAVTSMIRYRRKIVFSASHAVWMFDAFLVLSANWISLWDFHGAGAISIWTVAGGFVLSTTNYLVCALVSPEFEDERDFDLRLFHDEQGRTYLGAFLLLVVVSIGINLGGSIVGLQKWVSENALVLPMLPVVAIPLFVRSRWVSFASGIAFAILVVAYTLVYYPILR